MSTTPRPLRILNVLFDDRYSGPLNRVIQVGTRLRERGIETVLVLPEGSGNAEDFAREAGVTVRRVRFGRVPRPTDVRRVLRWGLRLPGDVRRFARLFRAERAGAAHVNGAFFLAPALAARLSGTPLVWHLNDTLVPTRFASPLGGLVRLLANLIVTSSESVAEHYGVASAPHEVAYTPVDGERFAGFENHEARDADGPLRVGLVGNWNPLKGHEHFVRAAALVRERLQAGGRRVEFVLAGQRLETYPDYAQRVDDLIATLGLGPYVRDLGFVNPIDPVLAELDVLVSCSTAEAAAQTAVVEGMAAALPVVVTDVGGVREMMGTPGSEAGIVVPPRSPEETAEAVVRLLESSAERARLGANGRRLASERFSVANSAEVHERVYRGVAKGGGGGHVILTDQFYYPDSSSNAQLLTELSLGLKHRGWRVGVVTSNDEYARPERPAPVDPEDEGIEVRRTPPLSSGSFRRGKLLRQLWYVANAALVLLRAPAPDLYAPFTTPPLGPLAVSLVARLKRRPYAVVAQDLYPEALVAHGMLDPKGRAYGLLRSVLDRVYRGAEVVISVGPYMTRRILEKGVPADRIKEIPNWSVGDVSPWTGPNTLRYEWGLEDKFVLLYSGNMGLGHEFGTFLQGLEEAKRELPDLAVVFVGGGPRRAEIEAWVREHGAEGWFLFRPYQPIDRLSESLGVADLSLVTMRDGWEGIVVPCKVQGLLAAGSPVLYVGPDGDLSEFLDRLSTGVHVRNGDAEGVKAAILRAARDEGWRAAAAENAAAGYRKHLSASVTFDSYDEVLSGLLSRT